MSGKVHKNRGVYESFVLKGKKMVPNAKSGLK